MDTRNTGNASTQTPPNNDPNPTRYFPPQETPKPEVPGTSPYNAGQPYPNYQGAGQQAAPNPNAQSGGYAQPQYNSYGQVQTTTQPYYHTPSSGMRDRDRSILAVALIGGGLLFLLGQFSFFPSFGDMVLLLIGGVFMYAYLTTKPGYRLGFLIPGSILLGIGAGAFLEGFAPINWIFQGSLSAITLGLGFCMIWFFERRMWWSLIPGGIILLGGLSSAFKLFALWPVVLIALGLYMLVSQSRRRPR